MNILHGKARGGRKEGSKEGRKVGSRAVKASDSVLFVFNNCFVFALSPVLFLLSFALVFILSSLLIVSAFRAEAEREIEQSRAGFTHVITSPVALWIYAR